VGGFPALDVTDGRHLHRPVRGSLPVVRKPVVVVEPNFVLSRDFGARFVEWRFLDPQGGQSMPKGKHMRGVGAQERRQYEHIKESAEKSGRYGKRATEVAARTVMKEHEKKEHGKGK
jgi:hypothetical protein